MTEKLSTQSYKGTRDFFPEEMRIQNYIFNTWKRVCKSFGFEEYNGPILESFEIFEAKSGDEIVNNQLYAFTDKGGRKVAIRPEMTPTVARMVSQKIQEGYPTPIKWFSIANFYRYEKPQKGRLREFYQLNVDIFGEDSVNADAEILLLNQKIMEEFNAKPDMYKIKVNNRYLVDYLFEEKLKISGNQKLQVAKTVDKKSKMSETEFTNALADTELGTDQIAKLEEILNYTVDDVKKIKNLPKGAQQLTELFDLVEMFNIPSIEYDPSTVRGLDYYDGNVFEQFNMAEGNARSMFGGGRYDGLTSLFLKESVPGVGYAPGDVTFRDFLESWNLIPNLLEEKYLVTLWPSENPKFIETQLKVARQLRNEGKIVETWIEGETDLSKQLKYADKKDFTYVVIIGEDELSKGKYALKNMNNGEQTTKDLE